MNTKSILLTLLTLLILNVSSNAGIVYVDSANVSGIQSGTSWATAFPNFQSGIDVAKAGDSVWVAKGTYKAEYRTTYVMKEDVKIFGGFTNTSSSFSQRDWQNNPTILMGNYHVVISNYNIPLTNKAVLDGFEITNGLAAMGAGLHLDNASPTINNCTFYGDTVASGYARGAAIYNYNSNSIITNCTFKNNYVKYNIKDSEIGGGAIYNVNSNVRIAGCYFLSNRTDFDASGGAIFNYNSTTIIEDCIFEKNFANNYGGAICNGYRSTATINNCTFIENTTSAGGAIANLEYSSLTVNNCVFERNVANLATTGSKSPSGGGAILANYYIKIDSCIFEGNRTAGNGSAILTSHLLSSQINACIFRNNTSDRGGTIYNAYSSNISSISNSKILSNQSANAGAGIDNHAGKTVITNCLFAKNRATGNWASGAAGAIRNTAKGNCKIINATIVQNTAMDGLSVVNEDSSTISIENTIVWGNNGGFLNKEGSSSVIQYSLVQGLEANAAHYNMDGLLNPKFVDTAKELYHLLPSSPCINSGNNNAISSGYVQDIEGKVRIFDQQIELGAYEYTAELAPLTDFWNDTTICSGTRLVLVAPYAAKSTYLWNTGDTSRMINIDITTTQQYYVTIANTLGTSSDTIQIIVEPSPVVNLGNDAVATPGTVLTLDAGNPGCTYRWNTGETTQTIVVSSSGIYSVRATNSKGCWDTDSIAVNFTVGTHDIQQANRSWWVYPNPFKERITVTVLDKAMIGSTLTLMDLPGKVLMEKMVTQEVQNIPMPDLPAGIYLLRSGNGHVFKIEKY